MFGYIALVSKATIRTAEQISGQGKGHIITHAVTVPTILGALKRNHPPKPDTLYPEIDKAVPKAAPKAVQRKTQRTGFACFYQNFE